MNDTPLNDGNPAKAGPDAPAPEDLLLRKPKVISPGLMFLVLAVPVIIAAYAGLAGTAVEPVEAPPAATQGASPEEGARRVSSVAGSGKGRRAGPDECSFLSLNGKMIDQQALNKIQAAGYTYRLLKPGSAMTMDHNPYRVNLETNDAGYITRVWCG